MPLVDLLINFAGWAIHGNRRRQRTHLMSTEVMILEPRILPTPSPILVAGQLGTTFYYEGLNDQSDLFNMTEFGEFLGSGQSGQVDLSINRTTEEYTATGHGKSIVTVTDNQVTLTSSLSYQYNGGDPFGIYMSTYDEIRIWIPGSGTTQYSVTVELVITNSNADGNSYMTSSIQKASLSGNTDIVHFSKGGSDQNGSPSQSQSGTFDSFPVAFIINGTDYVPSGMQLKDNLEGRPAKQGENLWYCNSQMTSELTVTFEAQVGDVTLQSTHFTGTDDKPSSKIGFDWEYWSDASFSGSDSFTADLYYSTDQALDASDVPISKSVTIVADSARDAGHGTIDFGQQTPLMPNKTRPYVLVVLDNGDDEADLTNNVGSLLLPFLDIKTVAADAAVPRVNRKWESTLLHETSMILDASPVLEGRTFEIQYRRVKDDSPMSNEQVDWYTFGETTSFVARATHRLAGLFEYRATVEINGNRFTSEIYSGNTPAKPNPQIQVLFPRGNDIAANPEVALESRKIFEAIDRMIIESGYQFVREAQVYYILDTNTGKFTLGGYDLGDPSPMVPTKGKRRAHIAVKPPPEDVYQAQTRTAQYVVAHMHTHPRIDPHPPLDDVLIAPVGQSTGPKSDEANVPKLPKLIGMGLPTFVYGYVGEPASDLFGRLQLRVPKKFVGLNVYHSSYNYFNDPGKLYVFGWQRRVNRKP